MIGYKLIQDRDVKWRVNQKGLIPLSPPEQIEINDQNLLLNLMASNSALYIRWESDFDMIETSPWWHVICDKHLKLESLSKNTRSKIRRGLKIFYTHSLTRNQLLEEGYSVYDSAFKRYETHEKKFDEKEFVNAISNMPSNTEFWGVREKDTDKLVAFSENYIDHNTCFWNTIWFEPDSLKSYSSYVLFYNLIEHYLDERGFSYISDGSRSISHGTQIHSFLESKFGFRKAYAILNVRYQSFIGVCVRILFPFRKLIALMPLRIFKMLSILLKQEEIHRQCRF